MTDFNEKIGGLILKIHNTEEFKDTWNGFVTSNMIDSDYTLKEICSHFFAFGAIDAIQKYINEQSK